MKDLSLKLCIDCDHFQRLGQRCNEPRNEKVDLVLGTVTHRNAPSDMRAYSKSSSYGSGGVCGSEGAWFRAKS